MNKRFKRYQKLFAISLATLYCSGIETDAFSFRGMGKKISEKFSAIFHRPKKESVYCIDYKQNAENTQKLRVANVKLSELVTKYGLYNKEQNKELSIALEDYAQNLNINGDPSLKTLLEDCGSDPSTLALVLIERDNRNELKDNSTKRLMGWYRKYLDEHQDDEMSKYLTYQKYPELPLTFADEIRRIIKNPKINKEKAEENLRALVADQTRMGDDKNAKKWLEFLKVPVTEGRLSYTQGIGWLLSHYFEEKHAPSAKDAETVIELINIYETFITNLSNKNLMEAVKSSLIDPLTKQEVRKYIYSYMILKETWLAPQKELIEETFKNKEPIDVNGNNLKETKKQLFLLLRQTAPRLLTHENDYQLRRHINTTLRKLTGEYKDATATTMTHMLFESITGFFLNPMKDPAQVEKQN